MIRTLSRIRPVRRGFTLLEVMIAFAVLGIGLIMVAAIFPAALLEHSRTIDQSRALDEAAKAETMLHNRINPKRLYVDNVALANGFDSPWYAIPFHNMTVGATPLDLDGDGVQDNGWDNALYPPLPRGTPYPTQTFYAGLNNTPTFANPVQLFGLDYLSDTVLPRTDEIANASNNRLVWHGFYRTTASGTRHFAVAVCKQRQNKNFARQDISATLPADRYGNPKVDQRQLNDIANDTGGPSVLSRTRFPVPWRVTVGRLPNSKTLTIPNLLADGTPLARLAPRGAKLLIQGRTYTNQGGGVLDFPGGRVLTVLDTDGLNKIQILEDISDIEAFDVGNEGFRFDVWLFPPSIVGQNGFENESPVLEWKVSL